MPGGRASERVAGLLEHERAQGTRRGTKARAKEAPTPVYMDSRKSDS